MSLFVPMSRPIQIRTDWFVFSLWVSRMRHLVVTGERAFVLGQWVFNKGLWLLAGMKPQRGRERDAIRVSWCESDLWKVYILDLIFFGVFKRKDVDWSAEGFEVFGVFFGKVVFDLNDNGFLVSQHKYLGSVTGLNVMKKKKKLKPWRVWALWVPSY